MQTTTILCLMAACAATSVLEFKEGAVTCELTLDASTSTLESNCDFKTTTAGGVTARLDALESTVATHNSDIQALKAGNVKRIELEGVTYIKINQWNGDTTDKATTVVQAATLTATANEQAPTTAKLSDDEINTLRNNAQKRSGKNIYMVRSTDSSKHLFMSSALPYVDTYHTFGFLGDIEQMVQSSYEVPTSWRGLSEWGNVDSYRVEGQTCNRWFLGHCGAHSNGGCETYPVHESNRRSFNGGASCSDNTHANGNTHGRLRNIEIFLAVAWPLPVPDFTSDGVTWQKINNWAADTTAETSAAVCADVLAHDIISTCKLADAQINTLRASSTCKPAGKNVYMLRAPAASKNLFLRSSSDYRDTGYSFGFNAGIEQMVQSGYGIPGSFRGISEWGNIDNYRAEGQTCNRWFSGHCGGSHGVDGSCETYPRDEDNRRSFNGGASCTGAYATQIDGNSHGRLNQVEVFIAMAC